MVRLCFGRQEQLDDQPDYLCYRNARRFPYKLLQRATNNFSEDRYIGKGGFATVYRGVLPNGTLIAVKIYKPQKPGIRTVSLQEFLRMVEIISCIQHPNFNQVIGYCIHKSHRLLVSEYVDNGCLRDLLNKYQEKQCESVFSWPMRVAVCIGIARGLACFHGDVNPRAVHCDIKPENILLDTNFTPKITDFDLVMFFPTSDHDELPLEAAVDRTSGVFDSDSILHLSTLAGTIGYLDPELCHSFRVTQKSDVYGFGVTMLEIISGRKPIDHSYYADSRYICTWALNLLRDGRVSEIIDPVLTDFPTDDVQRFIDVACLCIKIESKQRPSMREVMQMLDGACNSFGRQLLTTYSPHYFSAASSFRSSFTQTDDEGEGATESAVLDTILQAQPQTEGAEASAAPSNAATVSQVLVQQQQQLGVVLSGTGDLVERLSQTMVFNKSPKLDFPEAVYPPFRTREFRRGGSRNLYTF